MHSKPLSQGSSLLSSFLVLVWWLLVLGMCPASSLIALVLLWPLLNLIVHFMCNEGRLHSGLSWVSTEPASAGGCRLSSAATLIHSAQSQARGASARTASLGAVLMLYLMLCSGSSDAGCQ